MAAAAAAGDAKYYELYRRSRCVRLGGQLERSG